MTWTYDAADLSEDDATGRRTIIRLVIGDTDTTDQQLQDEEIDYFLDTNDDALPATSKQCVLALIAKYSREVDTWMGHTRVERSQRVRNYKALLEKLENDISRLVASMRAGGLTLSEKDSDRSDSDAVQPFFRRDMDNDLTRPSVASLED